MITVQQRRREDGSLFLPYYSLLYIFVSFLHGGVWGSAGERFFLNGWSKRVFMPNYLISKIGEHRA